MDFIGGKARNLKFLEGEGYRVPRFEILDSKIIWRFFRDNGLDNRFLRRVFFEFDREKALKELKNVRKIADRYIFDFDLKKLNSKRVIVRSSADFEDSETASFAGIFDSAVVNNNKQDLNRGIIKVLKGLFSEKIYFYLNEKKINKIPRLGIFVQEYIRGDFSGVLFSEYRKRGVKGIMINAKKGGAEGVVSGEKSDLYFFDKNFNLIEGNKNKIIDLDKLKKVALLGKKLENLFKGPQDIEWTIKDGKIFILQSRPITYSNKEYRVWDNSNIAESYSGIVLPLTSSFARKSYREAYINLVKVVKLKDKKIKENIEIFDNLIGFFKGRLYYNILNWYRMMTFFPGYEKNRDDLNNMISLKSKEDLNEEYKKNVGFFSKVKYYGLIAVLYPFFDFRVSKFKKFVLKRFSDFDKLNLKRLSDGELINRYQSLEKDLLPRWSMTLENDFLLMGYFGKLKRMAKKRGLKDKELIGFFSEIGNLISARQVSYLSRLAEFVWNNKKISSLMDKNKFSESYEKIFSEREFIELRKEFENYFKTFGSRFANELKLESSSLKDDPEKFMELLFLYKDYDSEFKMGAKKGTDHGLFFRHIVNKIRKHTRLREEFRLMRANAFDIVRRIFVEIGKRLESFGVLENYGDIFYLEVEEVRNYVNGNSVDENLSGLVKFRRKEYSIFEKIDSGKVFVSEGNPYVSAVNIKDNKLGLGGVACSPGIVKGKIKILNRFELPGKEGYEIVVVKNTDPGWTPLFGLCKGLIVEQGGLLSHAAIVSRELKLPCIIGFENARGLFKDGQKVIMNGFTGEVKLDE